jgi:hypothetical protein
MEPFEEPIMYYLTHEGGVLVVPQCSIKDDRGGELRCHDFVALNFRKSEVQVVEVKTGPSQRLGDLVRDVNNRETAWYAPLRAQLQREGISVAAGWRFVTRIFVRRDAVDYVLQRLTDRTAVVIEGIEDVSFSWTWAWPKV